MARGSGRPVGSNAAGKTLSLEALLARRAEAREAGRRVVHCHGCFDIVHPGHIRHLRFARAQGDLLLVSITGDAGVRKGTGRPLIPQELRAENLAELDCVDWVHIDEHDTAAELLEQVRPDVYIKGGEYEFNDDPRFRAERETVERHGGRVVFSSGDVVFSSSVLIAAMERSVDPFHGRLSQLASSDDLSPARLGRAIEDFRGRRVLVIGDVVRDTYVFCDRPRVAAESPVLTLRPLEQRHFDGGAAIVARHAAALGAHATLVTVLPETEEADALRRRLSAEGVEVRSLGAGTALAEKQRFLVGTQKVMKVDHVRPVVLDAARQEAFVRIAREAARSAPCDAAIIADFGVGLMTPAVVGSLCRGLRPDVGVLAGDTSGGRGGLRAMRRMDLLCPSEPELRDAYGNHGDGVPAVAWELMQETQARASIVTMGAEGLIAFGRLPESAPERTGWESRLRGEHVPALIPHAVDALGCGDALLATATLALASGSTLLTAAFLGAAGAAVQGRRIGNVPVSASDLRREASRVLEAHMTYAPAEVVSAGGLRLAGAVREAS